MPAFFSDCPLVSCSQYLLWALMCQALCSGAGVYACYLEHRAQGLRLTQAQP